MATPRTQSNWHCKPLAVTADFDPLVKGLYTVMLASGKFADCSVVSNATHLITAGAGCCMDIRVTAVGTLTTLPAYKTAMEALWPSNSVAVAAWLTPTVAKQVFWCMDKANSKTTT
jgi:hypothetical protein